MKTPISYYGGKQNMLQHILPLIPKHKTYIEPYFGGGAVFWAKAPSENEVINDYNFQVVNFYRTLQTDFDALKQKVDATLHSRDLYKQAKVMYYNPFLFDPVNLAWAFWILTSQGFANIIQTWGYTKSNQRPKSIFNKKEQFTKEISNRLLHVQIENNEAYKVMESRWSEDSFIYADPPYVGTLLGHYGGYEEIHFRRDLDVLAKTPGKFLLSSYPSEILNEYIQKHGWYSKTYSKSLSASNGAKLNQRSTKTEVLTANYPI
ncbi:MAG: DNA adenine methylase [Flavobacteriales bacterium]